jgi:flagellar motility protein MotE (MotC chaperone)
MMSYHPDSGAHGGSKSREETAQIRKEMEDRRLVMQKEVEESLSKIKALLETPPPRPESLPEHPES